MIKKFRLIIVIMLFGAKAFAQDNDVAAYVAAGTKLHDAGDYKGAMVEYGKALAIDPKSPAANYEAASTSFAMKEYKQAINFCDVVLDTKSDTRRLAYVLKGTVQDVTGNAADAIATYKKGIKQFPESYLLQYNLALTYYNQQDTKNAEEAVNMSLKLNPAHGSSHLLLGYLMKDQQNRIKSLLALYNFLLVEPGSSRSAVAFKLLNDQLNQGVSKKNDSTINITINSLALGSGKKENEFGPAEMMISLLGASSSLDENKKLTPAQLFAKNNESLFAVLGETRDKKKGFWWSFYVDFFYALKEAKHTEAFSYYISQSSDDKSIADWLDTNKAKVDAMKEWVGDYNRNTK